MGSNVFIIILNGNIQEESGGMHRNTRVYSTRKYKAKKTFLLICYRITVF